MFKFYHNLLSSAFQYFFTPISSRHKYNTRLSSKSAFCILTARTNYGKFNIRFKGAVLLKFHPKQTYEEIRNAIS